MPLSFQNKIRPVATTTSNLSFASKVKPVAQPAPVVEEPGFVQGLVQGVARPVLRIAYTGLNVLGGAMDIGKSLIQKATGQDEAAMATLNESKRLTDEANKKGADLGYFGNIKPYGADLGPDPTFGALLKEGVGAGLQLASNIPMAKTAGLTYNAAKTAYKAKALVPTLLKNALPLAGEGAITGGLYGTGSGLEQGQSVPESLWTGAKSAAVGAFAAPIIGTGLPLAVSGVKNIPKIKNIAPESASIMNRIAKINPTDELKFKKMSGGKDVGTYLAETGNMNNRADIITNEAKKFTDSIKEVDDAFASLPGRFKSSQLDNALNDLVEREAKIGIPDDETKFVTEMFNKSKTVGLDMSEINAVKRKFERDVKLSYNKLTDVGGINVKRSTRIDDGLRNWQFKEAEKLGFLNPGEINKQTQLSKFIVNKLGAKMDAQLGNNAITLTDWIMLSGGDPSAIAGFLTKKFFSAEGTQAALARAVAKGEAKGPITAKFGGKTGLPALIPGRDYSIPKTPTMQPKYKTISLPTSAREATLGITAGQKKPLLPRQSQIKSEMPYKDIVPPAKKKARPLTPQKKDNKEYKNILDGEGFVKNTVPPEMLETKTTSGWKPLTTKKPNSQAGFIGENILKGVALGTAGATGLLAISNKLSEKYPVEIKFAKPEKDKTDEILDRISLQESGGDITAIGDKDMVEKAYGEFQVRKPALTEVNKITNNRYSDDPKELSPAENRSVAKIYLQKVIPAELRYELNKQGVENYTITERDIVNAYNYGSSRYVRDVIIPKGQSKFYYYNKLMK